jgi:hypothetical protein
MSYEIEDSENDTEQIYRPSNYYTDCLDMPLSRQERQDIEDEKNDD